MVLFGREADERGRNSFGAEAKEGRIRCQVGAEGEKRGELALVTTDRRRKHLVGCKRSYAEEGGV